MMYTATAIAEPTTGRRRSRTASTSSERRSGIASMSVLRNALIVPPNRPISAINQRLTSDVDVDSSGVAGALIELVEPERFGGALEPEPLAGVAEPAPEPPAGVAELDPEPPAGVEPAPLA